MRARRRPTRPGSSSSKPAGCSRISPRRTAYTLRGFAARPNLPTYEEVYGLRAAAIAVYPMYKGLARLVGMEILGKPATLDEQIGLLEQHWKDYDFFFLHYKYTDSTGEDGDFAAKVKRIEEFDAAVPRDSEAQADGAAGHRRPQHAVVPPQPQLAPGPHAAGLRLLPPGPLPQLQRKRIAPRRLGPVRSQAHDDPRPRQRETAGEIRRVGPAYQAGPSSAPRCPCLAVLDRDNRRHEPGPGQYARALGGGIAISAAGVLVCA
jgi:hypothetical protein